MTSNAKPIRPRLGFLGTGWIGRNRLERIAESGLAEVVLICDSSPARVEEALRVVPQAKAARDFEELLQADLDGVVIATPSALHAEQSIRALEKGLAVFCQKPLGRTAAEVESVVNVARKSNRLLGVDLSYRFTEGMRQVCEAVREARIGKLFACDLVFHNAYGPDKPWFYDSKLSGGGCVMDLGVHLVDLVLWVMGYPEVTSLTSNLFADGQRLRKGAAHVEDYATATLNLSNGAVAQLACSWKLSAGYDAIIAANFYGTEGGLSFHNVNGSFYDFVAEEFRGTSRTVLAAPPDAWSGRAAVEWARQLQKDSAFSREICDSIQVAKVLDAIYGGG